MSGMVFCSRISVVRGAACFVSLCVHRGCPHDLHPGCCWEHHNYSAPSAHPFPASLTGGGIPWPHRRTWLAPLLPTVPHHTGCRTGIRPGLPGACQRLLPPRPCAVLALRAPAPGPEITHVSLESPEDHLHAPGSFTLTGPRCWALIPTTSGMRAVPGQPFGHSAGSAQLPSLCLLCPPRCCLLPAPPPL